MPLGVLSNGEGPLLERCLAAAGLRRASPMFSCRRGARFKTAGPSIDSAPMRSAGRRATSCSCRATAGTPAARPGSATRRAGSIARARHSSASASSRIGPARTCARCSRRRLIPEPNSTLSENHHGTASRHGDQGAAARGIRHRPDPEALALVATLHRQFEPRRQELLAARVERAKRLDAGERPDFLAETRHVRDGDWKIAPVPRRCSAGASRSPARSSARWSSTR